jgi:hypothetical protein
MKAPVNESTKNKKANIGHLRESNHQGVAGVSAQQQQMMVADDNVRFFIPAGLGRNTTTRRKTTTRTKR